MVVVKTKYRAYLQLNSCFEFGVELELDNFQSMWISPRLHFDNSNRSCKIKQR